MNLKYPQIEKAFEWLEKADGRNILVPEEHCKTRDVFEGRLIRMATSMEKNSELSNHASILFGIVGELGNNSFDHNIGKWRDEAGVLYVYDLSNRFVVIADRGQGVLSSLRRVKPELKNESEAIEVAFHERISGRAPESRGNGLKFVAKNVIERKFELYFSSGEATILVPNYEPNESKKAILHGVLAILFF